MQRTLLLQKLCIPKRKKKCIVIVAQRWAMAVRYKRGSGKDSGIREQHGASPRDIILQVHLRPAEALVISLLTIPPWGEGIIPQLPVNPMTQARIGETERRRRQEPFTEAKMRQVDIILPTMPKTSRDLFSFSCFVWGGAGLAFFPWDLL